jgi:hypothetical protein
MILGTSARDERGGATRTVNSRITIMTVLEALAILEAAVLECKKRNVNRPEVGEALDSLERYVRPEWLIPQFCHHVLSERTNNAVDRLRFDKSTGQAQENVPGATDTIAYG